MEIPIFTTFPTIQDDTAFSQLRVVSQEEQTLSNRKGPAAGRFESRETLLGWGREFDSVKFIVGGNLARYLMKLHIESVLSLGCGDCLHEFALKYETPQVNIIATDYDPFVIERVKELFPEIDRAEVFDITKDDFSQYKGQCEAILMIGVDYTLSRSEMLSLFRRVKETGARHLIIIRSCISIRRALIGKAYLAMGYHPPGRFHGWARTRGEFKKLVKMVSGIKLRGMLPVEKVILIHLNLNQS